MVAVIGWLPEQGANPTICATGTPAKSRGPDGPGTLVSTPTALLAKKLVMNRASAEGEADTAYCRPKVSTASSECLMRSIR